MLSKRSHIQAQKKLKNPHDGWSMKLLQYQMDVHQPNPDTSYKCGYGVKSTGFTYLMVLIMGLKRNPRLIHEIQRVIRVDPDQVNQVNTIGWSPLKLACHNYSKFKNPAVLNLLIDAGADIHCFDLLYMLCCCTPAPHDTIMKVVTMGVNVNSKTSDGDTALNKLLCERPKPQVTEIVKLCVGKGMNVNIVHDSGKTALYYAIYWQHIDVIPILIDADADVYHVYEGVSMLDMINADEKLQTAEIARAVRDSCAMVNFETEFQQIMANTLARLTRYANH